MAYIGKQPLVGNFTLLDSITATTTDTYALTKDSVAVFPQTPANCIVSLNGVIQAPTDSYTISGSDIVFASALTGSDSIDFITVLGDVLNVGTVSDGTIGLAKLSATGTKDATTFLRGDNTFASAGGGKVLQVVSATSTAVVSTSSLTFASLSFAGSITPSSATSKIFVIMTFTHELSNFAAFNIDRNGTLLSNQSYGLGGEQAGNINMLTTLQFLDSPNTTSPVTYTLFGLVSAGSVTLQGNSTKSLVLMEIAP